MSKRRQRPLERFDGAVAGQAASRAAVQGVEHGHGQAVVVTVADADAAAEAHHRHFLTAQSALERDVTKFVTEGGGKVLGGVNPREQWVLAAVVMFEYLGVGLGTAAFVAFMARATNKRFTATQFALFSSFIALPGIAVGSFAGVLIEWLGYTHFFLLCTALAIPGLAMLPSTAPWTEKNRKPLTPAG